MAKYNFFLLHKSQPNIMQHVRLLQLHWWICLFYFIFFRCLVNVCLLCIEYWQTGEFRFQKYDDLERERESVEDPLSLSPTPIWKYGHRRAFANALVLSGISNLSNFSSTVCMCKCDMMWCDVTVPMCVRR